MSHTASNGSGDSIVNESDDDGDGFEDYRPPSDRFLAAQMWWIASELVRRHPHLRISGVEVNDGARLLIVHDEQDSMSVQWDLVGGCKFLVDGVVGSISWITMMAADNPHEILKRIEVATGLGIPKATPATTPRALTYRAIASVLTTATNDRHEWYAVPALMLTDDEPEGASSSYFDCFATAIVARTEYEDRAAAELEAGRAVYFFQPFSALLRDLEPVAIFDNAGTIHTIMGATELLPVYESIHHNLSLTAARVIGPYLP